MPKFAAVSTRCRNGCLFEADASLAQLHVICNLGVVGSNPTRGSKELTIENEQWTIKLSIGKGQLPEWPNGADCNSAGLRLRWFESITAHEKCGSSSVDRALAFQAEGRGFESRLPLLHLPK